MGGKAFKDGSTRRVSAAEFAEIRARFLTEVTTRHPELRLEALKSYGNKPDFGNLSVFLQSMGMAVDGFIYHYLRDTVAGGKCITQGERVTLNYRGFQVDVTFVQPRHFQFALDYHAFNGMGGLIGKVAHSIGLALRETGMRYRWVEGDQLVADIEVANTWQQALTLLGYSHARWSEGFASLDEMFAFIADNDFFDPQAFMDVAPAIEGERPTVVQLFSTYLQSASRPAARPVEDKLTLLFDRIPGFRETHNAVAAQWTQAQAQRKAAQAKFNGNLVAQWTGRAGRELGVLMQSIETLMGGKDGVRDWALSTSDETIRTAVMELHRGPGNMASA